MQTFTGWEYLLIDAANQFGLDKDNFEPRIAWATENLNQLEELAEDKQWKERPLYLKAVQAIRKAQRGEATGHMVGFDAICSGMQIMSAMTGCESGARATGLVDTGERPDAYTSVTDAMRTILGHLRKVDRADAKDATMKTLYGSKEEPKKIFGDGTPELNAFYEALYQVAPGACELLQDLLGSWDAGTLAHSWLLPDGFLARVRVMVEHETRLEVDELDHATFTYKYYENAPAPKGLANAANAVHSVDAYVLRSLIRRCSYNRELMEWAASYIELILMERATGWHEPVDEFWLDESFKALLERYRTTGMADVLILDHAREWEMRALSSDHLRALAQIVNSMLEHQPFPIICVHDEFKCHANNMNHLRQHYINILAELAESRVLDDILTQLYKVEGSFPKKSANLGALIRQANYPLS